MEYDDQIDDTGEEDNTSDFAAMPNAGGSNPLSGIMAAQRKSIADMYDNIAANIQKRYRAPDTSDLLLAIGAGMLAPPGENEAGGFAGSLQRGMRGVGQYAASRRDYKDELNKMLSQVDTQKATSLAGLESKYLSAAAAAAKPKLPRTVGTQVVGGKVVVVTQDPETGEVSSQQLGEAPANLKPVSGALSGGQPVFMDTNGNFMLADKTPVSQFDTKAAKLSPTEQRQIFNLEDALQSHQGAINNLKDAISLNDMAYEGSLTGARKVLGKLFASDSPEYKATEDLDNLVMGSMLASLKSTFGANPTEGERRILKEIQASSDVPRNVRATIFKRALKTMQQKLERDTQRLSALKSGGYSTTTPVAPARSSSKPIIVNWK